jgi:hypothetical protein
MAIDRTSAVWAMRSKAESSSSSSLVFRGRACGGFPDGYGWRTASWPAARRLDSPGIPTGGIAGGLLEHRRRPFAAAETERIGDACAMAEFCLAADRVQTAHAQQIPQVGDDPFFARFDEPVVVQPLDVRVDDAGLLGEHRDERRQRLAMLDVPQTVDRGEQFVDLLRRQAHGVISDSSMPAGCTVKSSAGLTSDAVSSHEATRAGSRRLGAAGSPSK